MPWYAEAFHATLIQGLQIAERELLLFALVWFIIGMVDEMAVDAIWLILKAKNGITPWLPARVHDRPLQHHPLSAPIAVLIPAWREAQVIGATIRHMLDAWPQRDYRLYVGCYHNDTDTITAVMRASGQDLRLRLIIGPRPGPTTKADCLNRLYAAMERDEARYGRRYHGVVLHDAEDMVHPLALGLIDRALAYVDFVQLPVRPELASGGQWVAGHYADEFTESHAKTLVVRDALGAAIPAAGVGCGFARAMLEKVSKVRGRAGERGPFAADCLTEDYELGIVITRLGGRGRFLRWRDASGALIATRSYFPATLPAAVRQKARWVHGIALQGWDRLGWRGGLLETWMALRDRKGVLTALVLAIAYLLLALEGCLAMLRAAGTPVPPLDSPMLRIMLRISFAGLVWRAALRCLFTGREYGWAEGLKALARMPLANILAIMAGRRALMAYMRALSGGAITWEKTEHRLHPATSNRSDPSGDRKA